MFSVFRVVFGYLGLLGPLASSGFVVCLRSVGVFWVFGGISGV